MNSILRYSLLLVLTLFLVMIVIPLILKVTFFISHSNEKEEELKAEIELQYQEIMRAREDKHQDIQEKKKQDELKRKDEERMAQVRQKYNMRMDARRKAKLRESQAKSQVNEHEESGIVLEDTTHNVTTYEQYPIVHSNYDSILNAIDYTPSN